MVIAASILLAVDVFSSMAITSVSVKISARKERKSQKPFSIDWSTSSSSSFSSSTFQLDRSTFLTRQPTRPKLDSAACARALSHLSQLPQSEIDGNGFF